MKSVKTSNEDIKARVANAFRAMKAIGITEIKVKPVLKELLKLFDKNWALIEEENYRALADAILERDKRQAEEHLKKNVISEAQEEEAQTAKEPERPLKRTRLRHQDGGQTSSSKTCNSSMLKTPLVSPKEPDELSENHLHKLNGSNSENHLHKVNGSKGKVESPQHNARKTKQAVTCQSPDSSRVKQPISSKSLASKDHGDPSKSSTNRRQQNARLQNVSRIHSHPMKLRDRGKETASLQIPPKGKSPVPRSSSHAVPPLKLPKVDILSSRKKNKATSHALVEPKDEQITGEMPYPEVPDVIIKTTTVRGGDSLNRNGFLDTPEPSISQSVSEEETYDGTATLYESKNSGELHIASGACSSSSLEIASSASGEVKITLSYNLAPERPDFHTPSLEAVLNSVEDKYRKSTKTLEPKIPMPDLMKEICECFLKLGSESNSQSLIMESTPPIDLVSKSSGTDARRLRSGAKAPLPKSTVHSPPCNGIDSRPQLAKSDARDEVVINRLNQENSAEKNGLSLEITRSLRDVVDIAKGHENVVITLVNEVNDESPPSFNYIPQNAVFQSAYMNFSLARVGDDNCCATCSGDCLSLSIPCACSYETGGDFSYTTDGLVKEELLNECISMNRNPKKHCQFFCEECPLERSKCEDIIEPCKGHLVRRFIKECWRKCGCNKQCGNRVVQRGITCKLQVFMTQGKGWGLRTVEDLPKGAFVCEYVGEVLTNAELFERVLRKSEGEKHSYPVLLDADWCAEGVLKDEEALCLDATHYGNVARFINHKCYDSNLVEIPVEVETPDHHYYHLAFFTTRKVRAMEELTWDYGIDFDDHEHPIKAFRCQCGSKFCRNIKRPRSRARGW